MDIQMPQGVNEDLLTSQLKATMPATCGGIVHANGATIVTVVFTPDPPSTSDAATAMAICAAHDPTQKTAAQLATAATDAVISPQALAIDTEIARLEALTVAALSTTPLAVAEIVRQAKDLAFIARVLKRRGVL